MIKLSLYHSHRGHRDRRGFCFATKPLRHEVNVAIFDREGIITDGQRGWQLGGELIDYWYSAEGEPRNAVMVVLGIFGNERMKIIKVTI